MNYPLEVSVDRQEISERNFDAWPFIFFSGIFCFLLSLIWLHLALTGFNHPLYNGVSIGFIFLASFIVLLFSAQRSLVLQTLSVLLTCFYTQRVVVTYFAPQGFDYNEHMGFTTQSIQITAQFYFLSVLSMLVGAVVLRPFFSWVMASSTRDRDVQLPNIQYINIRINFSKLCRAALWIVIVGFIYKFTVMASGFGMTGSVYAPEKVALKWSLGIADVLSPFVIFSLLYFPSGSREKKLATIALGFLILNGFALASKGFILAMLVSYYLTMRVIGKEFSRNFILYALTLLLVSIFIVFPTMTVLRDTLLYRALSFDSSSYVDLISNAAMIFSTRMGGFDWLAFWISMGLNQIPESATVWNEFVVLLNHLLPRGWIEQPELVNLAKLQLGLGRGLDVNLNELGGAGENAGGLGTAYIVWGQPAAFLYFSFCAGALTLLERLVIHPFHKFTVLYSYLVVFIIGGGAVLMHGAFFWYLACTLCLVMVVSTSAVLHSLLVSRSLKKSNGNVHDTVDVRESTGLAPSK